MWGLLFLLVFAESKVLPQRSFQPGTALSHLIYSPPNIYVGGTNSLYQLDVRLDRIASISTGPANDSPKCHASGCDYGINVTKILTDNFNKALVLDSESKKLIYCGSLYQGSCWRYDSSNISSSEPEFIPEPVAANDENSSTFAFVGPQRYNRWGRGNALYVGTTYTGLGDYRQDVPALSSRNLHDLSFAEFSFSKQSLLRIDVKFRDRFLVQYIYGFNSSNHIYFVTIQPESHHPGGEEKGVVTRLSRVCISDSNFDTYTEITLNCGGIFDRIEDILYVQESEILYGVFSSEKYSNESAICSYDLKNIERQFDENVHRCFNGSMSHRNMEYVSGTILEGKCPESGKSGNIVDFCQVGLRISGSTPITESPLITLDFIPSSLSYAQLRNIPLILLGTNDGKVIKYSAKIPDELTFLENTLVPGNIKPVKEILVIKDELFTLQSDKVSAFNASECGIFSSCGDCLKASNPFCGWCPLDNKCSMKSRCKSQWFPPGKRRSKCLHLDKIVPAAISISNPVFEVALDIKYLPELPPGESFVCVVGLHRAPAKLIENGLSCPIEPPFSGSNLSLSLTFSGSETYLLDSLSIPLYDCSKQRSCKDCSSTFDCYWCMESSQCYSTQMECPSSGLLDYRSLLHRSDCPSFNTSGIPEIPNDVPTALKLPFNENILGLYPPGSSFYCSVRIENAQFKVSATVVDSIVYCDSTRYEYSAPTPTLLASLSVLVNDHDVIDKSNITLYKCSEIGPDCSLCASSNPKYGCSWCGNKCSSDCSVPTICPRSTVLGINPKSGPLEGGTLVNITGMDLARTPSDASGKIILGEAPCNFLNFEVSLSVTCRSSPVITQQNATILYDGVGTGVTFEYKDYFMTHVSPSRGPKSGGTLLTISGINLDIGSTARIYLDGVLCQVKSPRTSRKLTCITSGVSEVITSQSVILMIDGSRKSIRHRYTFTPDPLVREIKPTISFLSGGRILTVHGEFLNSVQEPRMVLRLEDGLTAASDCYVFSSRLMECETPPVSSFISSVQNKKNGSGLAAASTASGFQQFEIGFVMDNVTDLLHLSKSYPGVQSKLSFVEDPSYYPFSTSKEYNGDELVLEGSKLNLASDIGDVRVNIGDELCNITSLTESQLVCFPPKRSPKRPAYVVVRVGRSLSFNIGELVYDASLGGQETFSSEIVGGVSAAAVMLVFLAAAGLILYRHKSSQAEREYKRIQIQMDTLENNVRSECKQAFAELQTDMTDLTLELETTGVPIRDHRAWILNILFPGVTDHPISSMPREESKHPALNQLESLLHNKCFLLTLVDVLEKQPSFSIRDRVNFASLITIVVYSDMEYLTDVLRSLLLKLVEKSVHSKHPCLMLRRTESVVEKLLTNWLALTLYGYMKEFAGSSLFLLFKAVKTQTEKGPVDSITQEAKYSLCESGLLRDSPISYSVITCFVLQREFEEAFQTKVLDCDTISQVKSKILDSVYKNTPFSLRPSVDEIDLEWQCGQEAHVVLQDLDLTSKETPGGGKRLNTLSHYGVKGSAVVSLVPKQHSSPSSYGYSGSNVYLYHLKEPECSAKTTLKHKTLIPEIYLTRLLSTKGTLQKFIDDFFATVFSVNSKFPIVIKWLYDIFDEAGLRNSVDSESIHSWKANSVPLRFWISVLKSPELLFDVEKTFTVESNLGIVGQAFMDACSPVEPKLNKESPSHKLLFAKDTADYGGLVKESFALVREMPPVSDQELNYFLRTLSSAHGSQFNTSAALVEILSYLNQYYGELYRALSENKLSNHLGLPQKLESIYKQPGSSPTS